MDAAELAAILSRDFVGGIDNEALDFSQLADFINSEGSQANSPYFNDSLNNSASTDKLLNVIVENKRNNNGHSLPDSPPDSSSEHPYSPQDGATEPNLNENIYALGQNIYKPTLLNPIISDSLILSSHIVVTDNGNEQIIENNTLLQPMVDERMLLTSENLTENQTFPERMYKHEDMVHINFAAHNNIDINIPNQQLEANIETVPVYTNLQAAKKRKLSQESLHVKSEPENFQQKEAASSGDLSASIDDDYANSEACLSESQYQCIKFSPFLQNQWHALCDQNLTELPTPHYRVDADKGFNFSNADDAFVCQKKNHFQITCHVQLLGDAQFVKTPEGFQKISSFHIHFYGVKHDCPTQTIRVEQSQSDRSKKPFHPVLIELVNSQVTKITVGRLHFSETTSNNMRKKGKPNPEQRYFQLVVGLHAHTSSGNFPIISHASQKIIVRASNPGQFESDVELCWQKGQTQDSVFHNGKVGINTDRPDESLVVHGNIKVTGHIIQPSDIRAKKNIIECDTAAQLRNVQKLRVVRYDYDPNFAAQLSRSSECSDTGVIAQEVAEILPEAVSPAGDLLLENGISIDNFLVVNKERIFMENIGAVKELCKVTDNLGSRIEQLERINRRLNKIKRGDSLKSTSTDGSTKIPHISRKCPKHYPHKCINDDSDELCSNKFIQIVIIILVLIMAFCLAAITILYLMETARYNQFALSLENSQNNRINPKRPTKSSKMYTWPTFSSMSSTVGSRPGVHRLTVDANLIKKTYTIGKPLDCLNVDQDLENSNLCQIYCCTSAMSVPAEFNFDRKTHAMINRTALPLLDKNKLVKTFHSNDIEKQGRHKRSSLELNEEPAGAFYITEDHIFSITIQGRNFNTTLTDKYLISINSYNYTYSVPISKYMPDDYINIIFRALQPSIKGLEHCKKDFKGHECLFDNSAFYSDQTATAKHKISENIAEWLPNSNSAVFEVDMTDFQAKTMTYRAGLLQGQNLCKSSKIGYEYIEYNFYFHRLCEE